MEIIEQLYREYAGACYGVACGMLGDSHAAQDVVQEAFLRVWKQRGRLDLTDAVRARGLLMVVVKNLCRMQLRRPQQELAPEPFFDPRAMISAREELRRILGVLQDFPPGERDVLVLYYFYDLTTPRIARLLRLGVPAVRQRLSRGRRRLTEALKEDRQ